MFIIPEQVEKAYQKEISFTQRGIQLKYSEFNPFEYPQQWGAFILM